MLALRRTSYLAAAILAVVACAEPNEPENPTVAPSTGAPGLVSSRQDGSAALPPGHPSVDPATAPQLRPPVPAGGGAALTWQVPDGWVEETPSSSMRRAQYKVDGEAGPAECVVYYFGPGQGGGADANAARWADQFSQPDGRSSREVMSGERFDLGGMAVLVVEVTGTYDGGMAMTGSAEALTDHALLGAIAEGPDANWFFKLTGPEPTVKASRESFHAMVRSLGR